jgi:hypothetical protein
MQIKTTLRFHLTLVGMAIKKTASINIGEDAGGGGMSLPKCYCWNVN